MDAEVSPLGRPPREVDDHGIGGSGAQRARLFHAAANQERRRLESRPLQPLNAFAGFRFVPVDH
jgi:hypothetical protein